MKNIETIKKAVALLKSKHVRVVSDGPSEMVDIMGGLNLDAYGINVGIAEDTSSKCFKHNYNVSPLTFKSLVDLVWYIQPRNVNETYFSNLFGSFRCSKYVVVSPVQKDLEYWTMLFKNKGFHYNENLTNKLGDGCLVFGNTAEVDAPPSEDWKELEEAMYEESIVEAIKNHQPMTKVVPELTQETMQKEVDEIKVINDDVPALDELEYTADFDVELTETINIALADAEDDIVDATRVPLNPKSGLPLRDNQKLIDGEVVTYNKNGSVRKKSGPKNKK